MMPLLDLQNDFIQTLMDQNHNTLPIADTDANTISATQRLQIYRNNFITTLTELLKNTYPAILRLVGEKFFTATAKAFLATTFPTNSDVNTFGENFSDFLATFTHTQTIAYLPAMAQFEWACHRAYFADSCSLLDLNQVKHIHPDHYGAIKFKLHTSHQLLDCPYPILDIWRMCQESDDAQYTIDLSTGGQQLLVIRPELTVNMLILTPGEFALLSAFSNDRNFAEACAQAISVEPELKIDICLQKHLLAHHFAVIASASVAI